MVTTDVYIKNDTIYKICGNLSDITESYTEINGEGKFLLPGIIDDQVHFREPGLTHKATIFSESKAAAAGGVTSFMEMPNTNPTSTTIPLLEEKYNIAKQNAWVNYSFYLGGTNINIEEVKKVNPKTVCGVKVFMGSSTGDMLVDNEHQLEDIFKHSPTLIATHCEDETTVKQNVQAATEKYGEDIPVWEHPNIRNVEACFLSSSKAVSLATKHNARLHILHISTEKEVSLFTNSIPLKDKKITAEVCVHHLWFDAADYTQYGSLIKCNPAVKANQKEALWKALLDNHFDVIATDHAPHLMEEKKNMYAKSPSGVPLIQHSLQIMLEAYKQGKISLEKIVEKMCHAPAILYGIEHRGFIEEGYKADLVLVDLNTPELVSTNNIYYKCGWSPFEGQTFSSSIETTIVNGRIVYNKGLFTEVGLGERLTFNR